MFFTRNIFENSPKHSYYASIFIDGETNQRSLTIDENDKIIATKYGGQNTWITFGGQAFFTKELSSNLIAYMSKVYDNPLYANKYWVDFQDEHLEDLPMYIKRVERTDIVEFNTLESLRKFDPNFVSIYISKTMKYLCKELNTEEKELRNFIPIKDLNLATGCKFTFKDSNYKYTTQNKSIEKI